MTFSAGHAACRGGSFAAALEGEATLRQLGRSGLLITAALSLVVALALAAGSSGATLAVTALQFNGTSQYVRAGSVGSTPDALNAAQFTLETWFYRTGTGSTTSTGTGGVTAAPLIAKGRGQADGSNVDLNYFLGIDSSGRLVADFEEGAGQPSPGLNHPVTGSAVITNNAWHHAAVTYDGRTWKLYLDGRIDRTLTLPTALSPRSDSIQRTALASALNSSGTAAGFFRGRIDEARIWNVARTGQQIRQWKDDQITGPQSALLARFGMGEGSGSAVANSAGSPSGVLRPSGTGPTWVSGYTFPQDTTGPPVPGGLAAVAGSSTVTPSWSAVAASDLAGYDLYRSTSLPVTTTAGPVNGPDLLATTTYTDTGLANGTTYHYAVRAVDRSDNASALSASVSATPTAGSSDPVLLVAGDIAGCTWSGDQNTANVVNGLAGTVVTLGDNVYPNGTLSEFTNCYAPSWGQFKTRTRPTPGNHDYNTSGASGYFDYFNGAGNQTGPAGDRSLGYYSFDVGSWHIVVLNSECETSTGLWLKGGCAVGSAQETWFKADLAAATTNNVIVTWHKPRYSSSTEHGNSAHMQALWKVAYDRGVDLVLSGHSHNYERFAPMNASGAIDATFGMRTIVVGTGGASYHGFVTPAATSEVRNSGTHGVLKLTLHTSSYDWQFVPVAGKTFADAGTQAVHGTPPPP